MSFVEVATVDQVPPGTMKNFSVGSKRILVVNQGGKFYAIDGICTHAGGNLGEGKLEGTIVTCPRHGSKFDVGTGKCIAGPKVAFVRLMKARDTVAYQVRIDGGSLKIDV